MKKDCIIAIDPVSGSKLYSMSSSGVSSYCPATTDGSSVLLLGKTSECFCMHFVFCTTYIVIPNFSVYVFV